jgi:transcriptional regulator with XRE-family HTH domain/tetratricopeptide (TPR) repeat protein
MTIDGRPLFGPELRRRRSEIGLSLTELGKMVHYSKSHLSKVETGAKAASLDLARLCDAALGCDGALAQLVNPSSINKSAQINATPGELWMLGLSADGRSQFHTMSKHEALATGISGLRSPAQASAGPGADESSLASFRVMFDEARKLGQRMSPSVLTPVLVAHTHSLRAIAAQARPAIRRAALVLAARFAEYTGWMAQENGDDARAAWWTDQAVDLAAAGADDDMAAYALVRRALITLYQHDAIETVELAQRAQAARCSARVRGLAAQREAQGHAIAGDFNECMRCLDRAAVLLRQSNAAEAGPIIGTTNVPDPVAATTGWCLYDLGQPARSIEIIQAELSRIPDTALRAKARYQTRLALALAGEGEVPQACATIEQVLDGHQQVDSATVRADLRNLARTLNRWHSQPQVRLTMPKITAALRSPQPAW